MKEKRFFTVPLLVCVSLISGVSFILSAGSCHFSSDGLTMISGDYTSPRLENFTLLTENEAVISFSRDVSFPKLNFYLVKPDCKDAQYLNTVKVQENSRNSSSSIKNTEIKDYTLVFPSDLSAEHTYILAGTVKDEIGSSLTFTLSYTGYNPRVPKLLFSEISTEYSKPRTEFVEFYALEDGNLAGMILHSAGDGSEKDFIFPSVEVQKGEYIVLHMRTIEDGAINEYGQNINLSISTQSSSTGRDLWISGKETRLSKNDVLLLRERINGSLVDAVAYRDGKKDDWTKDSMKTYIAEAVTAGVWGGSVSVQDAINVEKITATRTLSRQNITDIAHQFDAGIKNIANNSNQWIIVAKSNVSAGKENSSKAYIE